MRQFATSIAPLLLPGDALILTGELGAGKTTLVRAIAGAMGIDERLVSSPTFVIVNAYERPDGTRLVHADAYRIAGAEEFESAGFDAAAAGGAIILVEWGEKVAEALGPDAATLTLRITGEHSREIELLAPDDWAMRPGIGALRGPARCPVTGVPVDASNPSYPFVDERARLADLHRWLSGSYRIERHDSGEGIG